jgi:4-hydroxy-tetrahydrodipicolinate synthase
MTKPKLKGSFVALITPFKDDGTPDIEGFGRLIEFQAAHGTSALLIMGSTGEVSLLSQEERHQIISETVKFRKHGLPLYFGCTGNNTRETSRMVQYAARAGADGAVITVPSYIQYSCAGRRRGSVFSGRGGCKPYSHRHLQQPHPRGDRPAG